MCKIILTVLILCISIHHAFQYEMTEAEISKPDFDVFVFTQHWAISVCKWYAGNKSKCSFPSGDYPYWTIHGIWPRKYGANYTFCNTSWAFDPKVIAPIEAELEMRWINVFKFPNDKDQYGFWRHEWLKHGTCALDIEGFNSQFKYFKKAIEWHQKYSVWNMLSTAKLSPSDTRKFTAEQFTDAVKAYTKKTPMIGCYTIDDVLYLHELRICVDKELNVIDCGPPIDKITCFPSKPVFYPENV